MTRESRKDLKKSILDLIVTTTDGEATYSFVELLFNEIEADLKKNKIKAIEYYNDKS